MRLLIFLLLAMIPLFANSASACSCAPIDTFVFEAYGESSRVILGVPTAAKSNGEQGFSQETSFRVVSSLKGCAADVVVRSRKLDAACGVTFTPNSGLYLVYVYEKADGMLYTTACSSTVVDPAREEVTRALKILAGLSDKR